MTGHSYNALVAYVPDVTRKGRHCICK